MRVVVTIANSILWGSAVGTSACEHFQYSATDIVVVLNIGTEELISTHAVLTSGSSAAIRAE